MYGTLYRILLKALGEGHYLVKRMKQLIDTAADPKNKITRFPEKKDPSRLAKNDLNLGDKTAINDEDLKTEFLPELEKLVEYGPDGFSKLPIEQVGNAFRNVMRIGRRLTMSGEKKGLEAVDTTNILDLKTKQPVSQEGILGLQTKYGLPSNLPSPRESSLSKNLQALKQKGGELEAELQAMKTGKSPDDIIPEPGSELEKMFKREPGMMGKEYHDAMNQQFAKKLYSHYDDDTVEKIVGWYNNREDARKLKKLLQQKYGVEKTPYEIMTPVTNELINRFIKAGKIKLSPGTEKGMLNFDRSGLRGKPVETFMEYFGVDNMEVLDNFIASKGPNFLNNNTPKEVADQFLKEFPDIINTEFKKRTGGQLKVMNKPVRDMLTHSEKVNFLTGYGSETDKLTKAEFEYLKKNIDPTDEDITSYIMQYVDKGPERVREVIKNLPEGYDPPEFLRKILNMNPEPELFAEGGRVGFAGGGSVGLPNVLRVDLQAGGPATPQQYLSALQKVGAGTDEQKLGSFGEYVKNYTKPLYDESGSMLSGDPTKTNPALRGIASFFGIGKPISNFSDFSTGTQDAIKNAIMKTVQNPTFNDYSKTNIPMSDYRNYFANRTAASDKGIFQEGYSSFGEQLKDMGAALLGDQDAIARMTLGRFNVDIDPTTGTGSIRDKYDFAKGSLGGIGKPYDINIPLPKDFIQQILNDTTYQKTTGYTPQTQQATTSSIPEFYQQNPSNYDFDKFREAYAYASGLQDKVSRTPEGEILVDFGSWDPSRTYQAYMANTGTSNNKPFFEQFAEGNPFQKDLLVSMYGAPGAGKAYYAQGGSVGLADILGV